MEYLKLALLIGFFIGSGMYIIGALLSSQDLRTKLISLWDAVDSAINRDHVGDVISIADSLLSAIYRRKGKLSITKLLGVTIVLNGVFIFSVSMSEIIFLKGVGPNSSGIFFSTESGILIYYLIIPVVVIILISSALAEYVSYKVTSYFVKLAKAKNSLVPVILDILILLLLFIFLPTLYAFNRFQGVELPAYLDAAGWLLLLATPYIQIFLLFMFFYDFIVYLHKFYIMGILSIFSVSLPTLLFMASLATVYNKKLLILFTAVLEKLEAYDSSRIRDYGLGICALTSGLVTILWA